MRFFRRRKFIVNKNLQYSLLVISLFYVVIFSMIVGLLLFVPLMIELEKAEGSSIKALQAAYQILYLHSHYWPAVLLSFIAVCLHSIRTSHKIAGPLYRLNLIFKTMKEGNLPGPYRLRKGDYLIKETEVVNQMLENLRVHVTEIQEAKSNLSEAIFECREIVSNASRDEITKCLNDISKKENQLGEKINYFNIKS